VMLESGNHAYVREDVEARSMRASKRKESRKMPPRPGPLVGRRELKKNYAAA
jgi:hypothetical protein